MKEINIYSKGLAHCSVCAPADMDIKEVTRQVNAQNHTGITSRWQLSSDPVFKDGTLNGHQQVCDGAHTRHWLMVC